MHLNILHVCGDHTSLQSESRRWSRLAHAVGGAQYYAWLISCYKCSGHRFTCIVLQYNIIHECRIQQYRNSHPRIPASRGGYGTGEVGPINSYLLRLLTTLTRICVQSEVEIQSPQQKSLTLASILRG